MMIASSPVEIEAQAQQSALPPDAHAAALRLFHALTDRIGRATAELGAPHEHWPRHRFYFGHAGTEMAPLLDGLRARPDILDVTQGWPAATPRLEGLYIHQEAAPFLAVLVAHQDHEGYLSPHR